MKKRGKDKSAAIVTIKAASKMTTKGRQRIAAWLIRQADFLLVHGKEFDTTFRARYLYR